MGANQFLRAGILLVLVSLFACQSAEKRAEGGIDQIASSYAHLAAYKEIQCRLNVRFSEPAKSAWLKKLFGEKHETTVGSNANVFRNIEQTGFSWRATPYRCRIQEDRLTAKGNAVREVFEDTSKKLEVVMCIWVQSFYADSPLRGWKKGDGTPEIRDGNFVIKKGEGRELEYSPDGKLAIARLGSNGVLRGQYALVSDRLFPQHIEYEKDKEIGKVTDLVYQSIYGRDLLKSIWTHMPSEPGQSLPAFQVEFSDCRWE